MWPEAEATAVRAEVERLIGAPERAEAPGAFAMFPRRFWAYVREDPLKITPIRIASDSGHNDRGPAKSAMRLIQVKMTTRGGNDTLLRIT